MKKADREKLIGRFSDDQEVDSAVKEAVRQALAEHKRKGNTIAVWGAGEVRIVKPDEIQVPGEDAVEQETQ